MNIVTNESLIRRNSRIAGVTILAGLMVLIAGSVIFFVRPNDFALSWGAVLIGFILSQIGIYLTNRYGRRPRPDEQLNDALKGLGDSYTLYHYNSPTSHLLLGPAGIWILMPRYQRGRISFVKGRWRQSGGGPLLAYMKVFGQEGLGRPDLEAEAEIDSVRRYLTKNLNEGAEIPAIQAALVFTDPRAEIENVEDAPIPALPPRKLKDIVRKMAKGKPITPDQLKRIEQVFESKKK